MTKQSIFISELKKALEKVPEKDRYIAFWIAIAPSLFVGLIACLQSIFLLPVFMLIFFGILYGHFMSGFHVKKIQSDHKDEFTKFDWNFNHPVNNAVIRSKRGGLEDLPKAILEDESLSEAVFWYKLTKSFSWLFIAAVLFSIFLMYLETQANGT